ncbi:MAG: hypothetical protein RJA19_1599 [Bacteroidota bacterium]
MKKKQNTSAGPGSAQATAKATVAATKTSAAAKAKAAKAAAAVGPAGLTPAAAAAVAARSVADRNLFPVPPLGGPDGQPLGTYLARIGVYGYGDVEAVVLAAAISGDPLLLVGQSGTGKTYLLNSLSEVLGLSHRHYNASLISFDDLVGFPMPDAEGQQVRYLETPATIWGAESVLVDEINRCRPEHQNRLFSVVHERRLQGVPLEKLRYRWGAMNPVDDVHGEVYGGCEPLDPALADRFAYVVNVKDWAELSLAEQRAVADASGEGVLSRDGGALAQFVEERTPIFQAFLRETPEQILQYFQQAATELVGAGIRISPRRVRQLVRNHCAMVAAGCGWGEQTLWLTLQWGVAQRAYQPPSESILRAAHRASWASCGFDPFEHWLFQIHRAPLAEKVPLLLAAPHPDQGTLAVNHILRQLSPALGVAFAAAVLPVLLRCEPCPVGMDGMEDLALKCQGILHRSGTCEWDDPRYGASSLPDLKHPMYQAAIEVARELGQERGMRFLNLISGLMLNQLFVGQEHLPKLEQQFFDVWQAAHATEAAHAAASAKPAPSAA